LGLDLLGSERSTPAIRRSDPDDEPIKLVPIMTVEGEDTESGMVRFPRWRAK
jgi:hypothetical protein